MNKKLSVLIAGAVLAFATAVPVTAFAAAVDFSNDRPLPMGQPTAGDGPGMQIILNSIFGDASVSATDDQSTAAAWAIYGLNPGILPVLQFEYAGYAGSNILGLWSGTDSAALTLRSLFNGVASSGAKAGVEWLTNTSGNIVQVSGTGGAVATGSFTGINRYSFGFYINTPDNNTFYSADSLNGGNAQMLAYQHTGQNRWVMGFEDLALSSTSADKDYNDLVFSVESVVAVPEPEIYAMLAAGLGLMGFIARRRKQHDDAVI